MEDETSKISQVVPQPESNLINQNELLHLKEQIQDLSQRNIELEKQYQEQVDYQTRFLCLVTQQLRVRKLKLIVDNLEDLRIVDDFETSEICKDTQEKKEHFEERIYTEEELGKITYLQKVFHKCHILKKWRTLAENYSKSGESKDSRKRYLLVKEIIHSESTYNSTLHLVITEYMNPLYNGVLDESIITKSDVDGIFSNLFAIKELSDDLLETLEAQYLRWPMTRLYFGELFEKLSPFFQCYSEFVINYQRSLMIITNLKEKKQFSTWVETVSSKEEFHGLHLHDCLIMPIQRVPRFVLLLKELLKYTPEYHIEFEGIKRGYEKTKQIAQQMNQKQKLAESIHRVYEIQNLISSGEHTIIKPHRKLIREGDVIEIDQNLGRCPRHACLFNDLIITVSSNLSNSSSNSPIYTLYSSFGEEKSASWKLQTFLSLENAMLTELPEDGSICPILISTPTTSLLLEFYTEDEKYEWLGDVGKVIAEMIEKDLSYSKIRENNLTSLKSAIASRATNSPIRGSHEGYLYAKQYSPSPWEKRWCVVSNGFLHIYEEELDVDEDKFVVINTDGEDDGPFEIDFNNLDNNNLKLLSSLKLNHYHIKQIADEFCGRLFCFELYSNPSDRYLLSAESQFDLEYWLTVINPYLNSNSSPKLCKEIAPLPAAIGTFLSKKSLNDSHPPNLNTNNKNNNNIISNNVNNVTTDNHVDEVHSKLNQEIINHKALKSTDNAKNKDNTTILEENQPNIFQQISSHLPLHHVEQNEAKTHHKIPVGSVKTAIADQ